MPSVAIDKTIRVSYVATIANQAAPTVAELNAGTLLQSMLTKDGLEMPSDTNDVDDASIADNFDASLPGTFGGPIQFTFKRRTGADPDTAWTLVVYGTTGFIVIRRQILESTAWTIAQPVEVLPGAWNQKMPVTPARNEQHRFQVKWNVRSPGWNLDAVVA
jgi:hypothetical protein